MTHFLQSNSFPHLHRQPVALPFKPCGILNADVDGGMKFLPDPRDPKKKGGRHFAEIFRHSIRTFRKKYSKPHVDGVIN